MLKNWQVMPPERLAVELSRQNDCNRGLRLDHYATLDPDSEAAKSLLVTWGREGKLPPTVAWRTASGAERWCFQRPPDLEGPLFIDSIKLQLRTGAGMQDVIPPSYVNDPQKGINGVYTWLPDQDPESVDVAPLPDFIYQYFKTHAGKPKEAPHRPQESTGEGHLGVEAYLAHYGREVVKIKPHGGGRLYCLKECVFNPDHNGNEAAIGQAADGKLFYQCFHDSCQGRTWAEARQIISGFENLRQFIPGGPPAHSLKPQVPPESDNKPTQAELLINLAADAELFHDLNRKGYTTIPVNGHLETWPIKSTAFRDWLRGQFYKAQGKPPSSQALQDTLDLLAAQARFDGPEHKIYVRVAHAGGKIYVDLANEKWEAVEITRLGWRVVDRPPVKFRRPRGLAPMPVPELGGNIGDLKPFVNCREDDWPLIVACVIGAFSPGPYPPLIIQAEQGTAKTTIAKILKSLVDPGHSPQRSAPRDVRDLMISASNSWCLSFDNLSVLRDWLSDGFCRLATGGGLSTRELYSDDSETILDAMRPVILNGIDSLVSRGDLADRAILLELPLILDVSRKRETDLWRDFEAAQPGILGAIFSGLSAALANIHKVNLPCLPRMADFATWVVAAESALPWEPGTFLAAYTRNRAAIVEQSLEGDPVAVALRSFMEHRQEWEGTPTELLDELTDVVGEPGSRSKNWPKAANGLSNRLRRASTFLRVGGIEVESGYVKRARHLSIRKVMQKTVATVATVATEENQGVTCNDPCNDATIPEKRSLQLKINNHAGCNDSNDCNDKIQDFSKGDDKPVLGEFDL